MSFQPLSASPSPTSTTTTKAMTSETRSHDNHDRHSSGRSITHKSMQPGPSSETPFRTNHDRILPRCGGGLSQVSSPALGSKSYRPSQRVGYDGHDNTANRGSRRENYLRWIAPALFDPLQIRRHGGASSTGATAHSHDAPCTSESRAASSWHGVPSQSLQDDGRSRLLLRQAIPPITPKTALSSFSRKPASPPPPSSSSTPLFDSHRNTNSFSLSNLARQHTPVPYREWPYAHSPESSISRSSLRQPYHALLWRETRKRTVFVYRSLEDGSIHVKQQPWLSSMVTKAVPQEWLRNSMKVFGDLDQGPVDIDAFYLQRSFGFGGPGPESMQPLKREWTPAKALLAAFERDLTDEPPGVDIVTSADDFDDMDRLVEPPSFIPGDFDGTPLNLPGSRARSSDHHQPHHSSSDFGRALLTLNAQITALAYDSGVIAAADDQRVYMLRPGDGLIVDEYYESFGVQCFDIRQGAQVSAAVGTHTGKISVFSRREGGGYSAIESADDFEGGVIGDADWGHGFFPTERSGDETLTGHAGTVTCLKLTDGGASLLSSAVDGKVNLWDLSSLTASGSVLSFGDGTFVNSFSSQGYGLAAGCSDGMVRLVDLRRRTAVHNALLGHDGRINSVAFDAYQLITGSSDRSIRIWDLRMGLALDTLRFDRGVSGVQLDARRLVFGLEGEEGLRVEYRGGRNQDHHGEVGRDDGDRRFDEGVARVWHEGGLSAFWYGDGRVVSGGMDGVVMLWE